MRAEAPAGGNSRPPTTKVAGQAGAPLKQPLAPVRPTMPIMLVHRGDRFGMSDPYVRRFWVAALGPSAVAELLRLVRAAGKGEDVRLPRSLPLLLRAQLVVVANGGLGVVDSVPEVPAQLRWRFPPSLAIEHSRYLAENP